MRPHDSEIINQPSQRYSEYKIMLLLMRKNCGVLLGCIMAVYTEAVPTVDAAAKMAGWLLGTDVQSFLRLLDPSQGPASVQFAEGLVVSLEWVKDMQTLQWWLVHSGYCQLVTIALELAECKLRHLA